MPRLSDEESWHAARAMSTRAGHQPAPGSMLRLMGFQRLLNEIAPALRLALQPLPGKQQLLGVKLYVYGFSRRAASARAFVNWLVMLLPNTFTKGAKPGLCLTQEGADWALPVSVEFLGLLDTVASVGVAHIAPFAEGHMGWADSAMELPDNGLIKRCLHLVSSHEQRLCFPLDSICRHDGTYPGYAKEVVYPGMHSDIGGGYPPGDQGKATAENDGYLLSQIALHDMYAEAFNAGAPLKVPVTTLSQTLLSQEWRAMPITLQQEFFIDLSLVNRFNAWRELTLNLPSAQNIPAEDAIHYSPVRAPVNVIAALEDQMAWMTAWRIGRYAHGGYKKQRFYHDAAADDMDRDKDPEQRKRSEAERNKKQKAIETLRKNMEASSKRGAYVPYPPGIKDFDPSLGQTQLREAAEEFREDYELIPRSRVGTWIYRGTDGLSKFVYIFSDDDIAAEYRKMKKTGNSRFETLFPPQGESSNAPQPGGLVRALFDDQVHDSRAWFMHATFGAREPWGSYFLYRMIYFGELMSKNVSVIVKVSRFVEYRLLGSIPGMSAHIDRIKKGQGAIKNIAPYEDAQPIPETAGVADIPLAMSTEVLFQPALTDETTVLLARHRQHLEDERLASIKSAIAQTAAECSQRRGV